MACIYRNSEKICVFLGHKYYTAAKIEETKKKLIEEENKRK